MQPSHPNLLSDSAEFHCNVSSRVSYSDHYGLFIPPLLRSLVVSAVEVLPCKSFNAWKNTELVTIAQSVFSLLLQEDFDLGL